MEYEPAEYQKLRIRQYAPRSLRETAEGKYWRRFQSPTVVKQFGGVTHLDFCQVYPFNLACTAATRVIVYDGLTRQVGRTFSRFKDTAYGGCFRSDGRLLVAGGQQGIVQVFDAGSRAVLRQLKGHQRAVHVARFAEDKVHVLSGSDDVTVRWWDVTSGTQLARLDGHEDYVRAAGLSPANAETWATGGYDHSVRLWDVRAGSGGSSGSACTLKLDHGAPVEDLAFFPSGSLLVTAGGNHLCVWDLVGGGRLLKKLANFQKTVSTVRMSPMAGPNSSAAPRLLAGSLDGHVKVFELDTFKVTHVSRYPAPVLSLAISPDCGLLAVGMADGTLSIRKHARPNAAAAAALVATGLPGGGARQPRRERYRPRLTAANFRYFIRGQSEKAAATDFRVAAQRKAKLTPYDKLLRQFKYRGALDAALSTRHPEVAASVLEELAARGGLAAAIGGRDADGLLLLMRHITKYITEPRYSRLLCGVAHRVLDAYAEVVGLSPQVDEAMAALRDRLAEELAVQRQLMELQGALEPLLAASLVAMAGL